MFRFQRKKEASESKYHNKKVELNGITFDSKKEATHYQKLLYLERAGEIKDLRLQVPFELIPAVYETETKQLKTKTKEVERCVQRATHYLADFVYTDKAGNTIVVDVKSAITRKNPAYLLKKKMMRAFLGITITEV